MTFTTRLLLPGPEWPSLSFHKSIQPHQKHFKVADKAIITIDLEESTGDMSHEVKTAWSVWDGVSRIDGWKRLIR